MGKNCLGSILSLVLNLMTNQWPRSQEDLQVWNLESGWRCLFRMRAWYVVTATAEGHTTEQEERGVRMTRTQNSTEQL